MNVVFKEQIVKRKPTIKDALIRACLIVVVVLVFLVTIVQFGAIGVLITAVVGFGANYVMGFLSVEYEYAITDKELDIDAIYARSRRKRVFSASLSNVEVMAHVSDNAHEHTFSRMQKLCDYTSATGNDNVYAFLLSYNGKYTKVLIEPNEKMLAAIAPAIGRGKLFLKK